jgi:hypothetical protein
VGARTSLNDVKRRKKSCPYRNSNSDHSAVQPLASRYTDCVIPVPLSEEQITKTYPVKQTQRVKEI